jgi:hypothetical protein
MISAKVDVSQALRTLHRVKGTKWAAAPAREAGRVLVKRLEKYPPPASPKRGAKVYRRTGRLGRGWSVSVSVLSGSVQIRLGNPVPYSPLVQGERTQARMHRGRWITEQAALRENMGKVKALFEAALEREASK